MTDEEEFADRHSVPMPGPGWGQVADATNHRARLLPWLASPPQLTAYPKDDSRCHSAAIASMLG